MKFLVQNLAKLLVTDNFVHFLVTRHQKSNKPSEWKEKKTVYYVLQVLI